MKTLHDAFDQALREAPDRIISELIAKKIAEHGITLSKREHESLVEQVRQGTGKLALRRWDWRWWKHRHIHLEITSDDLELATQKVNKLIERVPELFAEAMETTAEGVLVTLRRKWDRESRSQRRDDLRFARQHYEHWKRPLELLRMLLTISREVGESIISDLGESEDTALMINLIEVMSRSHARGCQITEEILCLLEGGYADGAMARWRSLHEVAVVASFIASHGESLAERYVSYQAVESKRSAEEYNRCAPELGYEELGPEELRAIHDAHDAATKKFGVGFGGKGEYRWAADHLKNQKPNFKDIEAEVGVGHLRSYYRMASHNVHANPMGVFFRLGVSSESQLLLAGASNEGLTDPGQCTALSLAQLSTALGTLGPTLDVCAAMKIINGLVPEISEAFADANKPRQ